MSDRKPQKQSKADIAKQFDLPERQSKITSLLNQAGQQYCICRSSDSSRFMIGCDSCLEWYHGDCINISEKEADFIKQYYCDRCRQEDPSLITRFKPQKDKDPGREDRKRKRKELSKSVEQFPAVAEAVRKGCGQCSGCTLVFDCGQCEVCLNAQKYGATPCRARTCTGSSQSTSHKSKASKTSGSSTRRYRSSSEGQDNSFNVIPSYLQSSEPRQCNGPQCIKQALYGSKYCSSSCGIHLATARIYQVLPQRIQEWSLQPCAAEAADRRALARVREKICEVQAALQKLEKRRASLDELCVFVKTLCIEETDEETDEEGEMSMYCITCGHEIHSRTAIKHMEKCFNKYEAQSSFGSVFKTRIEGNNMFCDFYNPANRTYCKRLKVLCPEHCKEPKISDTDVCGCPLVQNLFAPTGEFCRAPRKSCLKHHGWEKIRRAEVDMERVRQWLKIDELMEQERNIRYAMASRAGVLGLMLHSTYNHELMEKITSQLQQQQQQQQQQKQVAK